MNYLQQQQQIFRRSKLTILSSFFLIFINFPLNAQNLEKTHQDWHVLTTEKKSSKICYIACVPKSQDGNYKKRKEPYVLVSLFPSRAAEVSVSSGFIYKSGGHVDIQIGKKQYKLVKIKESLAWAKGIADDKSIIDDMKSGMELKVKATSKYNTYAIDSYSLKGFTAAYLDMIKICK